MAQRERKVSELCLTTHLCSIYRCEVYLKCAELMKRKISSASVVLRLAAVHNVDATMTHHVRVASDGGRA